MAAKLSPPSFSLQIRHDLRGFSAASADQTRYDMANTKSARKATRKIARRTEINKARRSAPARFGPQGRGSDRQRRPQARRWRRSRQPSRRSCAPRRRGVGSQEQREPQSFAARAPHRQARQVSAPAARASNYCQIARPVRRGLSCRIRVVCSGIAGRRRRTVIAAVKILFAFAVPATNASAAPKLEADAIGTSRNRLRWKFAQKIFRPHNDLTGIARAGLRKSLRHRHFAAGAGKK